MRARRFNSTPISRKRGRFDTTTNPTVPKVHHAPRPIPGVGATYTFVVAPSRWILACDTLDRDDRRRVGVGSVDDRWSAICHPMGRVALRRVALCLPWASDASPVRSTRPDPLTAFAQVRPCERGTRTPTALSGHRDCRRPRRTSGRIRTMSHGPDVGGAQQRPAPGGRSVRIGFGIGWLGNVIGSRSGRGRRPPPGGSPRWPDGTCRPGTPS